MNILRYSKAGAKLAVAALLAGFAVTAAPLGAGDAAAATKSKAASSPQTKSAARPAEAADPEAIAAKRDPQYTSATAGSGSPTDEGCLRQRKRLWVEGEGWLVRKVTVCP